ncbi:MAG TPA: hypothetical protein VFG65_03340 [Fimbriimonadales bacterium]|jgi:pyrroloquinoline-quinone synthase|nr:hypothetical protein [Fimbriimonadales bacterium]
MSRTSQLREIVLQFDLNKHPFYNDWRHGTLPVDKLDRYAEDYGHFVNIIADGWERIGQSDYAEEERVHHELWLAFAKAVRDLRNGDGTTEGKPALAETGALIDIVRTAFSAPASAIGGLYAFEVQQPVTAQTKLDGLTEHYKVGADGEKYFEEHAGDWAEVDTLEGIIGDMSEEDFAKCRSACENVAQAMWNALDGIYGSKN